MENFPFSNKIFAKFNQFIAKEIQDNTNNNKPYRKKA